MADGSIIIDTKIDTSGADQDLSGMEKSVRKFMEEYEKNGANAVKHQNELRTEIEKTKAALKDMEGKGYWIGDAEYDKALVKLEKLQQTAKEYRQEMLSPTPNANPFDLDTIAGKIRQAQIELSKLAESGKGFGSAEYDEAYRKLSLLRAEERAYAADLAKTPEQLEAVRVAEEQAAAAAENLRQIGETAQVSRQDIVDLRLELEQLTERQQMLQQAGLGFGYEEYDANASRIAEINAQLREYQAELQATSESETLGLSIKARVTSAFGKVGNAIKKVISHLKNLTKHSTKSGLSLKKIAMYALGIRSVYALFNKARNAIKEGFKNLAQYSTETNKSISSLMSALTRLKNSLAAAFAPILNVVSPILTRFIDQISDAVNKVGQLFAALTGSKTYIQATKVQQDYAASLNKTSSSANKAEKALNNYLSPVDDLNKMTKKEDTKSSGTSASDMFKTSPVTSEFNNLAKKIQDMWKNADFTELGSMLGDKINKAMNAIDWKKIRKTSEKIGKSIATFLNGGIETINWNKIGATLANGINTVVDFFYGAIENFHFDSAGKAIGDGLSGIFQTFDAVRAATTVSDFFKGIADTIDNAALSFDWKSMWKRAIEAITNIDYLGIAKKMLDAGAHIISGLAIGLVEAILDTDWLAIWDSIVESFKNFFGIHSPSTLFEEFGRYIIEGLVLGIESLVQKVFDLFERMKTQISQKFTEIKNNAIQFGSDIKQSVIDAFSNMKNRVLEIWDALKNGLKTPINGIIGFVNKMISAVVDGVNTVIRTLNRLHIDIPPAIQRFTGMSSFGFNIQTIKAPKIPYLATGAVIPANAPFLSVLGDQKNGTNLEAPESLLRKIVREESGGGAGGSYRFTAQINRRVLFDELIEEAKLRQSANNLNPFELR